MQRVWYPYKGARELAVSLRGLPVFLLVPRHFVFLYFLLLFSVEVAWLACSLGLVSVVEVRRHFRERSRNNEEKVGEEALTLFWGRTFVKNLRPFPRSLVTVLMKMLSRQFADSD